MQAVRTKRKLVVTGVLILASVLLMATWFTVMAMEQDIYAGVSVAGVEVGGKSAADAKALLESEFSDSRLGETIRFSCEGREFEIQRSAVGLEYDFDATVQQAYAMGRAANPFVRVGKMTVLRFAKQDIPLAVTYDAAALKGLIDENIHDLRTEVIPASIEVLEGRLQITNGISGRDVDMEQLEDTLEQRMAEHSLSETIPLALVTVPADPIDIDQLCNDYLTEPQDATYTIQNGSISYVPHTLGVQFDREQALQVLEANRNNDQPYDIAVEITYPAVTLEQLKGSLFQDNLGDYTSKYNPSEVGRTKNVTLATQKINGTYLAPGDQFSFNTVVGERTAAAGFQNAKVYEGGNLVDGLGGGICQVSSTLYNAVLYADLGVVYRTNHSMPVTYAPLGRDATVSFGSIDFIFKNNKQYPVKVVANASGGSLTISIWGTKEDNRVVELSTERLSTIPYPTREVRDDSLAPGTKRVKQNGSDGAVINTYKTIKENGVVVSSEMIHKSYYNPIEKIVLVGPDKAETPAEPANTQPADEVPPQEPAETPAEEQPAAEDTPAVPPSDNGVSAETASEPAGATQEEIQPLEPGHE